MGKPLGSGQGAIRQFLKSHKSRQGAQPQLKSKEVSAVGKPLGSGQGAIRQFLKSHKSRQGVSPNPIKPLPQHG